MKQFLIFLHAQVYRCSYLAYPFHTEIHYSPTDFSISGGEFTPTIKMKRPIILEKYHDLVTQM